MRKDKSRPCKYCTTETGRTESCHMTCEDYLAWKEKNDARKEKIRKKKIEEADYKGFKIEQIEKTRHRNNDRKTRGT